MWGNGHPWQTTRSPCSAPLLTVRYTVGHQAAVWPQVGGAPRTLVAARPGWDSPAKLNSVISVGEITPGRTALALID